MDPETRTETNAPNVFEARYRAFLETIAGLRPSLHRYCSRMTGSVLDGEDVVQEALFQAYRMLESFDDSRPLSPWLFRIAHNRCIDFLRYREVRRVAETADPGPDRVPPAEPPGTELGRAVEHLVLSLPPKERACVLLKDVFDYSLEEIAELVDSTVGGVKAALKRGRSKLPASPAPGAARRAAEEGDPDLARILHLYVERFNRRDWDGLRELISDDAQLRVGDRFAGRLSDSSYFGNYQRLPGAWRLMTGEVDGEPVVIVLYRNAAGIEHETAVRLEVTAGRIARIADYLHCPWVLAASGSVRVDRSLPN
jgi:RNA polymerase sigma-70 factor (ECF subfamily)